MFQKTGKLISLSEQNPVNCSQPQSNKDCNDGLMDNAFQYFKSNGGLDSEESYPYHAKAGSCKYKPENSVANDAHFVDIHQWERSLMKAVTTVGAISVAIDASCFSFWFYKEGVYYDPHCSSRNLDHSILVVGYGFEGAKSIHNKYWIVNIGKGKRWGMNGYAASCPTV